MVTLDLVIVVVSLDISNPLNIHCKIVHVIVEISFTIFCYDTRYCPCTVVYFISFEAIKIIK